MSASSACVPLALSLLLLPGPLQEPRPAPSRAPAERARSLLEAGKLDETLDVAEEALREAPADRDLLVLAARAWRGKADAARGTSTGGGQAALFLEDAAALLRRVMESHPRDLEARLLLGRCHLDLGDLDAAVEAAEAALDLAPEDAGALLLGGRVALARFVQAKRAAGGPSGAPGAASAHEARVRLTAAAERAAASRPAVAAEAWRALGDLHAWDGPGAEMAGFYARALALDPASGAPHQWLAEHMAPQAAAELYGEARAQRRRRTGGGDALLAWYHGLHLFRAGRWGDTRDAMREALDGDSTYRNALYYLGRAAWVDGEEEEAQRAFARYAREAPEAFADLLRAQGNQEELVAAMLVFLAARAYRERALEDSRALNHVVALVRDTAEDWNNYAFLCRETRAYEESYRAYRRALEKAPDDPNILNDCGLILQYHLHRDLDEAVRLYRLAIEAAERVLADPSSNDEARGLARRAISDARGNLARMGRR